MKNLIILFSAFLFGMTANAGVAVQRTTESSYADYKDYLEKSGKSSFADSFIQLSSVIEVETPLLEKCLEEVYLGAPANSVCLSAVKSLTAKPLNQPRRQILYSFLVKLEKVGSPHKGFYKDLRLGLLRTHHVLAKTFGATIPETDKNPTLVGSLEMKAWKKALQKKCPLEEASLLINGKKVSKLADWTAPQGVYQWSLVTNTHEPIVRLGTFAQFASESLKDLKPLAAGNCKNLPNIEAQKFGLMQIEIYSDKKCVAKYDMSTPKAQAGHLATAAEMVKLEKSSYRSWIWPVVALIGIGVASSFNGKQVNVQMPSFR